MNKSYCLGDLWDLQIEINRPSIVFLYWDLGAGKTTLSSEFIHRYTSIDHIITSPTYVYYNKYQDIYHFDLYRLRDYDEFISIWWEEILDNNSGIVFIEWPELLEPYYIPDVKIQIHKSNKEDTRKIEVTYKKEA